MSFPYRVGYLFGPLLQEVRRRHGSAAHLTTAWGSHALPGHCDYSLSQSRPRKTRESNDLVFCRSLYRVTWFCNILTNRQTAKPPKTCPLNREFFLLLSPPPRKLKTTFQVTLQEFEPQFVLNPTGTGTSCPNHQTSPTTTSREAELLTFVLLRPPFGASPRPRARLRNHRIWGHFLPWQYSPRESWPRALPAPGSRSGAISGPGRSCGASRSSDANAALFRLFRSWRPLVLLGFSGKHDKQNKWSLKTETHQVGGWPLPSWFGAWWFGGEGLNFSTSSPSTNPNHNSGLLECREPFRTNR